MADHHHLGAVDEAARADRHRGWHGAGTALFTVGAVLTCLVCALLLVLSLVCTATVDGLGTAEVLETMTLHTLGEPGALGVLVPGFVCAGIVLVCAAIAGRLAPKVNERVLLVIIVALALAFQVWWVAIQHTDHSWFPDSTNTMRYAAELARGDYGSFANWPSNVADMTDADRYFSMYPFQSGMVLYFMALFVVFGVNNVLAIQVASAVANCAVLVLLYLIGRMTLSGKRARVLLLLLLGSCWPFLLSSALPYGNAMGLALAVGYLALNVAAMRAEGRVRRALPVVVSVIPLALAVCIKSTFILIPIAVTGVWLFEAIRLRRAWALVASIVVLLGANAFSGLSVRALETLVHQDFGEGMPKVSWIALGLDGDNESGMPGWWDTDAYDRWVETDGDLGEQTRLALEDIGSSLSTVTTDPARVADFLVRKFETEWCEPMFQSLFYANINVDAGGNLFDVLAGGRPRGAMMSGAITFFDGYQLVVFAGALVGMVALIARRKLDALHLVLPAVLFVGFGCYVLWEAKSVYVLPFFVMMLPIAAEGLATVLSPLAGRRKKEGR